MNPHDAYTYQVVWSAEDEQYVAIALEFPSLSHLDSDPAVAINGIRDLVAAVLIDMREAGEPAPAPIAVHL